MTIDITIIADQEAFLVDAPTPHTHHNGGSRLSPVVNPVWAKAVPCRDPLCGEP